MTSAMAPVAVGKCPSNHSYATLPMMWTLALSRELTSYASYSGSS